MTPATLAAVLFAVSAVLAAIHALKENFFQRFNALALAVSAAAAGFFVMVQTFWKG